MSRRLGILVIILLLTAGMLHLVVVGLKDLCAFTSWMSVRLTRRSSSVTMRS